MLIKARDEFDIDLPASVLIGDKDSDIEAGRKAGVGRLLLLRGAYEVTPANDVTVYDSLVDIVAAELVC
jgi:D-glycero-D-manno-heptose 1,7-bisphosphate phosphatase